MTCDNPLSGVEEFGVCFGAFTLWRQVEVRGVNLWQIYNTALIPRILSKAGCLVCVRLPATGRSTRAALFFVEMVTLLSLVVVIVDCES